MHYRNRVFSTYVFGSQYVLSTDWYRKSILVQTGTTYLYVLRMYQNNVMYVGHQYYMIGAQISVGAPLHTCPAHIVLFPTGIQNKTASTAIFLYTQ